MKLRGGRMPSTRRALFILPLWIFCVLWMWLWWLQAQRVEYPPLFIALSAALFYEFAILPSVFLYFVLRARKPARRIAPKNKKVAVITLCVPSKESLDIIERQLEAMSKITYPHDSWVLDEGNSKEVKLLAKKHGVKHFSRRGIRKYNKKIAPFKAKTKAGNVNAWLDRVKWRKYDFFVQLDIDHIPKPEYLNKTLGYFKDEKVAWVQAPSVYKNLSHWTARGSAEQELVLQGPLQMGFYGHSETPFIIGSHCTYRTSAIREINGFQPTRAEDHLDTVALASKGWRGVFIPQIIAEGDGPETLSTYLAQQFAWAYSMFQVLLHHSPKLLKTMNWKRRFQFLFAQTWYPVWSLAYFIMFITPLIALSINREVANMNSADFATHFIPLFICSFLIWWSARPIMQPKEVTLSWRGLLLHAVRWPIVLYAVLSAAFKVKKPYMITPKGKYSKLVPSLATYRPFLVLGSISALAIIIATRNYGSHTLASQTIFALSNSMFMLMICTVDLNIWFRQNRIKLTQIRGGGPWLKPLTAVSLTILLTATSLLSSPLVTHQMVNALSPGLTPKSTIVSPPTTNRLVQEIAATKPRSFSSIPTLGIYNPNGVVSSSKPYIDHSFVNWNNDNILAQHLLADAKSGNMPLITLEPRGENNGQLLLSHINSGHYDNKLRQISNILKVYQGPVYLRFAHEMELAGVYPWGNQDPALYISAYRHVVNLLRTQGANNVKWVWSPAGNMGAENYYPGDDFVDVIGTTMLYDQYWYGNYKPSFYDVASPRQWLQTYGKPVWIVELGIGNEDPEFQSQLVKDAVRSYKVYGYKALVYLNTADANTPGPNYRLKASSSLDF